MDSNVQINPPFTDGYLEIQKLAGQAIAVAARDDVVELHKINRQLVNKSLELLQFSFLGVSIQQINDSMKKQKQEIDPPDDHPV